MKWIGLRGGFCCSGGNEDVGTGIVAWEVWGIVDWSCCCCVFFIGFGRTFGRALITGVISRPLDVRTAEVLCSMGWAIGGVPFFC